jgi:hypothetical protein
MYFLTCRDAGQGKYGGIKGWKMTEKGRRAGLVTLCFL